jgi:hypothetical protein
MLLNELSFAMDVAPPSLSNLLRSLVRERPSSGTLNAVCSLFQSMLATNSSKDMIHKYWNVTLKNEFAEVFAKRLEAPKVNGVELTPEMSEASLQRTEVLTHRAWAVLSYFEESCATSLSDMLLHVSKSEVPSALSASAAFIPKVEKFFATLEKLNRLQQAQDNTGPSKFNNVCQRF